MRRSGDGDVEDISDEMDVGVIGGLVGVAVEGRDVTVGGVDGGTVGGTVGSTVGDAVGDRVAAGVGDAEAGVTDTRAVDGTTVCVAVGDGVRVGTGVSAGAGVSVGVEVSVGGGVVVAARQTSSKRMVGGLGASLGVPMPQTHPTTAPGLTA